MPEVRRIRPEERPAVLDTVVAAFRDDPQMRWWFPDDDRYADLAGRFFGVLIDTRMEGGEVWVDDGCRAASLWVPPGGNFLGPETAELRYQEMLDGLPEDCAGRIRRTDDLVDQLLPRSPHWYLGVLACHPDHRGQGLGDAVAAPLLAAADRAGVPAALETASARNVGYYTRRGFAVAGRSRIGGSSPSRSLGSAVSAEAGGTASSTVVEASPETMTSMITIYVMMRQPR